MVLVTTYINIILTYFTKQVEPKLYRCPFSPCQWEGYEKSLLGKHLRAAIYKEGRLLMLDAIPQYTHHPALVYQWRQDNVQTKYVSGEKALLQQAEHSTNAYAADAMANFTTDPYP